MPTPITSEIDCWILYIDLIKTYREIIRRHVDGVYDNEIQMNKI